MTGKLAVLGHRRTTLMCLGSGELSRQTNTGEWLICHYRHGLLRKSGIECRPIQYQPAVATEPGCSSCLVP